MLRVCEYGATGKLSMERVNVAESQTAQFIVRQSPRKLSVWRPEPQTTECIALQSPRELNI